MTKLKQKHFYLISRPTTIVFSRYQNYDNFPDEFKTKAPFSSIKFITHHHCFHTLIRKKIKIYDYSLDEKKTEALFFNFKAPPPLFSQIQMKIFKSLIKVVCFRHLYQDFFSLASHKNNFFSQMFTCALNSNNIILV